MKYCVVVLDTMWTGRNSKYSPRYFNINPENKTGKRLHTWLDGHYKFVVTNACPQQVARASMHGTPDVEWLRANLASQARIDLLLLCGGVAQVTYFRIPEKDRRDLFIMEMLSIPHPAWRGWTRKTLDATQKKIAEIARRQDGNPNTAKVPSGKSASVPRR